MFLTNNKITATVRVEGAVLGEFIQFHEDGQYNFLFVNLDTPHGIFTAFYWLLPGCRYFFDRLFDCEYSEWRLLDNRARRER
jgi:hypothetical protein